MGIPNGFSFIPRFSRPPWLVSFIQWVQMAMGSINGLIGTSWQPVNLLTVAALPANAYNGTTKKLTATATGALTVDGVAVTAGMRIWANNEVTGSHCGLYSVLSPGSPAQNGQPASVYVLQRATDADTSGEYVQNKVFAVTQGATKANTLQKFVTSPFTLDTTTPVITDITGAATSGGGSGDMVLASVQTVTGAKTFNAGTLKANNAGNTFATLFASLATAARTVTFPDGAGTVIFDALAQTITGVKKFTASSLGVWNGSATFASLFTTNATADRTLVLPDLGGHVMLTETNDNISGTKTFADGTLKVNNPGGTFAATLTTTATAARAQVLPDAAGAVALDTTVKQLLFDGRNGAGACTAAGLKVGDKVIQLISTATGVASAKPDFESVITVNGQIQQTSVADLSANTYFGFVIGLP